jgi:hypothetical protein
MSIHDTACVPPRDEGRRAGGAGRRRPAEAAEGRGERILALLEIQIPPGPAVDPQFRQAAGAASRMRAPASFVA